jgi:hypothetical protein
MRYVGRVGRVGRGGRIVLALAVGGAVFGISTAVQASIPDASGVIHGCYSKSAAPGSQPGALRVIDTAVGQTCQVSEGSVNWSKTGPTGAEGPTGPTGQTGPSNAFYTTGFPGTPLGTSFETILSLSLPAGQYVLNGSMQFANNAVSAIVGCSVFLGVTQENPSFAQQMPNVANAKIEIPVTSAFTLASTTTVSVQCAASVALGAVPQPSSMAATHVGSLTTS